MVERFKLILKSWQRLEKCAYCNKEFITTKYKIEQNNGNNVFCSHKCYGNFRKIYYINEKSSSYKKTFTSCSNCSKQILVPPNKLNNKNKDGENHVFCSKECYYEFRKKFYVGDKLYNTGKKMSESFCNKVRENTLKQYANGILNRQTKPQKSTNLFLEELGISYINEKTFGYYSIDNYLYENNLIIEVMGDYFHANPNKYDSLNLNEMQLKNVSRDKRKHTYIKKYYDIEILYLWEYDILHNKDMCKLLIKKYIDNNGKLSDYNSFNFFIFENKLKLKDKITNPYFINNP